MMLRLAAFALMLMSSLSYADDFDWSSASKGVELDGVVAFSGCTPSANGSDASRRAAIMKAMVNIARTRRVAISGNEHLSKGDDASKYTEDITESARSLVKPVKVIEEGMATIDGVSNLCVLVEEQDHAH